MFECPFFQQAASFCTTHSVNIMVVVAAIGGAIGLGPVITDIRELSANNSFGNAICAALASRGFTAYMEMLRWVDWAHCMMYSADVFAHVHIETIYGKLSSVHLWNVSPEMVDWLRKNAHKKLDCVYHIHSFLHPGVAAPTTTNPFMPWVTDNYGVSIYTADENQGNDEDEDHEAILGPVPGVPTTFLGKYVCDDQTFFFTKENVVMADFHAITEMKQPLNIIGANVSINGDEMVTLPIPPNFECAHRVTLDVSPINPTKHVINLPMYVYFGSPTHLYQMLCELYTQQLADKNWADLRNTLSVLTQLKRNNYTYTINLTALDLTSKHFAYNNQQLISE
jgi:hypothetical protein